MNIKIQFLNLLQRLFLPWSLTRFVYLFLGSTIFVQAAIDGLWMGVVFGLYFIATGLFAWGCASGNCAAPAPKQNVRKEIEYTEL